MLKDLYESAEKQKGKKVGCVTRENFYAHFSHEAIISDVISGVAKEFTKVNTLATHTISPSRTKILLTVFTGEEPYVTYGFLCIELNWPAQACYGSGIVLRFMLIVKDLPLVPKIPKGTILRNLGATRPILYKNVIQEELINALSRTYKSSLDTYSVLLSGVGIMTNYIDHAVSAVTMIDREQVAFDSRITLSYSVACEDIVLKFVNLSKNKGYDNQGVANKLLIESKVNPEEGVEGEGVTLTISLWDE